jgi:hypothetical protein
VYTSYRSCGGADCSGTLVVLLGMRGWRKLSEMEQGVADTPQEVVERPFVRDNSSA